MQSSKTAYFQLSKKHRKLKENSAFINARNLFDDIIKCNSYFQALFSIVFIRFESLEFKIK